jgi:hypothetical protein
MDILRRGVYEMEQRARRDIGAPMASLVLLLYDEAGKYSKIGNLLSEYRSLHLLLGLLLSPLLALLGRLVLLQPILYGSKVHGP